jgi:hypothetical protein
VNKKLGEDGLRLDPQHAKEWNDARRKEETAWFYEDTRGLYCVVQYESGFGIRTKQFIIPKRSILEYARIAESL